MSLNVDLGLPSAGCWPSRVTTQIDSKDKLLKLAELLDWKAMIELILPDLQATAGHWWYLGRKLHVRLHLGVFILQALFKMTDRETERRIRECVIYQLFCGFGLLKHFHIPDHTKIEEFRNRLKPETQQKLAVKIVQLAVALGLAKVDSIDIDSTVQEAGIAYPSDASLLKKLAGKVQKVFEHIKGCGLDGLDGYKLNMELIARLARGYFFRAKNLPIEKSREYFRQFYETVKSEVMPIIQKLALLNLHQVSQLPWYIRKEIAFLVNHAGKYLADVSYFINHHTVKAGKLLSFHLNQVQCIAKGKIAKKYEFGRVFQLARLVGNFIVPLPCTSIQMNDKNSLIPIVQEYSEMFGADALKELSTDKAYYSNKNVKALQNQDNPISSDGVQRPSNIKNQPNGQRVEDLRRRRAGIEPLIGHVKRFGLNRSTMKSDRAVLASGYRSVLAFNLHQLKSKI